MSILFLAQTRYNLAMSISKEIEIKCLLGEKENADAFRDKLKERYPDAEIKPTTRQLNHYFIDGDFEKLKESIGEFLNNEQMEKLSMILEKGESFSVRTRDADGKVMLVVKATLGSDTSANGVSRLEFEEVVGMSLDELDKLLLDCGFNYQAKWSRQREEYVLPNMNITLDKNAGYGYLSEFESVISDEAEIENTKNMLLNEIASFGLQELPQDRLERMFDYYNKNWPDYYGTEKVFNIE